MDEQFAADIYEPRDASATQTHKLPAPSSLHMHRSKCLSPNTHEVRTSKTLPGLCSLLQTACLFQLQRTKIVPLWDTIYFNSLLLQ